MITEYTYNDIITAVCNWIKNNCENIDDLYVNELPRMLKTDEISTVIIPSTAVNMDNYDTTGEFDSTGKINNGNGDLGIAMCDIKVKNNYINSVESNTVISRFNSFITASGFRLSDTTTAVGVINLLNIITLFCKNNLIYVTSYFENNLHLIYKQSPANKASDIEIFRIDKPIVRKPLASLLENVVECVRANTRIVAIQYSYNLYWIKRVYTYSITLVQPSGYAINVYVNKNPVQLGVDKFEEGTVVNVKVNVNSDRLLSKIGGKYLLPSGSYSSIRWYDNTGQSDINFNLYGNVQLTAETRPKYKSVTFYDDASQSASTAQSTYDTVPRESSWQLPDAFSLFSSTHSADTYFFEYWKDASNNSYANCQHFNTGANIPDELFACWREKTKNITFYSDGCTSVTRTIANVDQQYTLPNPYSLFAKSTEFVTFSKWHGDNGSDYNELTPVFTPGSTTPTALTAYFTSNFTQITLHGNNGQTCIIDVHVKGHGIDTIGNHDGELNIDTAKWKFDNKWLDATGANRATLRINEDRPTDLTGQWSSNTSSATLTVVFDTDGGSAVSQQTASYVYDPTKPNELHTENIIATSTKDAYTFSNWTLYSGGISYANNVLTYTHATNNVMLKANWTASEYIWGKYTKYIIYYSWHLYSNVWSHVITVNDGIEFDIQYLGLNNNGHYNKMTIAGKSSGFRVYVGQCCGVENMYTAMYFEKLDNTTGLGTQSGLYIRYRPQSEDTGVRCQYSNVPLPSGTRIYSLIDCDRKSVLITNLQLKSIMTNVSISFYEKEKNDDKNGVFYIKLKNVIA